MPAATPPNDYVPAHAAAGYYVGCTILPLPIVSCMSANGPDEPVAAVPHGRDGGHA